MKRCFLNAFWLLTIYAVSHANGATLVVGSDGAGPLQLYTTAGALIGTFGPVDGSASASDGSGGLFIASPGDSSSLIGDYDSSQNLVSSFVFTAPTDTRDFASYIVDMNSGADNTLWISTYSGDVYQLSSTGAVLGSFDTDTTAPGVSFDGTYLYTTSGPGFSNSSPFIYQRDTSGNIINTIDTGLNDTLGLAVDPAGFFVGGFDALFQVSPDGTVLNSFAIDGTHYGVTEADLGPATQTPEPSSLALAVIGMIGVVLWKVRSTAPLLKARIPLVISGIMAGGIMHATVSIPSISASLASPQPVGTSITFTVSASDTDAGALRYQFSAGPAGGPFTILRDYSPANAITWTPVATDGSFQINAAVVNRTTSSTAFQSLLYVLTSRALGGSPMVNATNHPLVVLYSGPACPSRSSMRVRFKLPSDVSWQTTQLKTCNGATSMNFYVAGLRASSAYQFRQDVIAGPSVTSGPVLTFTTGAIPVQLSTVDPIKPLQPPSSQTEGVTLFAALNSQGYLPFAIDAELNPIWYAPTNQVYMTRPVPGGGYLVVYGFTTDLTNSGFRQYDIAGNLVQETNVERMNDQLAARSMNPVTTFHHEVRKLSNGNYLLLGMREVASDVQGPPDDIVGDMILVLDSNMQLLWAWDSFDHLDVSRKAVLGETCTNNPAGCVLFNSPTANDWLHGNSVALAADGNLVYSSRHQDFVYKIAYQNGTGDGHVVWRLGKGGDFVWNSSDAWPWFSHQHDAEYEDATTLSLFDDGNTRVQSMGGNSRGQGLILDEQNLTVNFAINVDVGRYSLVLGSAQRLLSGAYAFDSGFIDSGANTQSFESTASGIEVSNVHSNSVTYRTFRLRDLFSASY